MHHTRRTSAHLSREVRTHFNFSGYIYSFLPRWLEKDQFDVKVMVLSKAIELSSRHLNFLSVLTDDNK